VKIPSLSSVCKPWSNRHNFVMVTVLVNHFLLIQHHTYILHNYMLIYLCFVVALNDALMKEVERLKMATGEVLNNHSESFNMGMHQMPFAGSNFFSIPPHSGPSSHQNMQLPPYGISQSSMPAHQLQQTHSHQISDILQNDQLGRLQGLDISSKGSSFVKSEGPSISANDSSTTF